MTPDSPVVLSPDKQEILRLQQRLAALEASSGPVTPVPAPAVSPDMLQIQQRVAQLETQVRSSVFCYRCGEDRHLATDCKNPPNKKLVSEKVEARRKRKGLN